MQTLKRPETIALNGQVKVVISKEILDKIKFLCKNIAKVEWSGVLFYQVHGSIKDISTLSLEVKDIFLMHKGTQAYTEYSFDGDIAGFMMDKIIEDESWKDIKIGHIHSHNTMSVFFSGTDTDELLENSQNHSYYLSLIVNNFMDMTAKVAFKATIRNYIAFDESGAEYPLEVKLTQPKNIMFTYDCDIQLPQEEVLRVPTPFEERFKHIVEEDARKTQMAEEKRLENLKKAPINGNNFGTQPQNSWQNRTQGQNQHQGSFWDKPKPQMNLLPPVEDRAPFDEDRSDFAPHNNIFDEPDFDMVGANEKFTCFLLRRGELIPDDTIAEALGSVAASNESAGGLAQHMVTNFVPSYAEFFSEEPENAVMEDFLDVLEAIIENLVDFEQVKYAFIPELTEPLREFSMEIENAWKTALYTVN